MSRRLAANTPLRPVKRHKAVDVGSKATKEAQFLLQVDIRLEELTAATGVDPSPLELHEKRLKRLPPPPKKKYLGDEEGEDRAISLALGDPNYVGLPKEVVVRIIKSTSVVTKTILLRTSKALRTLLRGEGVWSSKLDWNFRLVDRTYPRPLPIDPLRSHEAKPPYGFLEHCLCERGLALGQQGAIWAWGIEEGLDKLEYKEERVLFYP
jgi:hypothetical protein